MDWKTLLAWASGDVQRELQLKVKFLAAENRILRDQLPGRPRLTDVQRATLAALGAKLGKTALEQIATIVTPETILRWHRKLVARKFDSSKNQPAKRVGRPAVENAITGNVLKFARENPTWGYRKITGALAGIGHQVSSQTVKNILAEHGIDPAPRRRKTTEWADFIRSHKDCLLATDFFTAEVWTAMGLVTYYVLFFIHVQTRKVYLAGITRNPVDAWMRQAARNLTFEGNELLGKVRYLIRDRDAKFTIGFDQIFKSVGIEVLRLPARSPNLNAYAERFVRSIKEECVDRMIFFGEASLRHAVTQYLEHYHHERPHQGKDNRLLFPLHPSDPSPRDGPIHCKQRLGGMLKFYYKEAA